MRQLKTAYPLPRDGPGSAGSRHTFADVMLLANLPSVALDDLGSYIGRYAQDPDNSIQGYGVRSAHMVSLGKPKGDMDLPPYSY
jgi:hypothetical protein